MGDYTKNISRHETKCNCGNCDVYIQPHEPILAIWQGACDHFADKYGVSKVQLEITSAARCYVYNRIPIEDGGPGSNDESQHPRCTAMDGKIFVNGKQIPPKEVYDYFDVRYPNSGGFSAYNTFTHGDGRQTKARW